MSKGVISMIGKPSLKNLKNWEDKAARWVVAGVAAILFTAVVPVIGAPGDDVLTIKGAVLNSLLYLNGDVNRAGSKAAADLKGAQNNLVILGVNFSNTVASQENQSLVANAEAAAEASIKPEIIGKPLFYPNPAKQSQNPRLYYVLSKNMDVEIRIYDMLANMIFKTAINAGAQGGKEGANWLTFGSDTFDQHSLSAGVYFFLVMHEGKVLGKGKVAIVP
ncbi:T9SS C-terminal target domain-containing protein [bacterium]|nr:T9SS C-terminal target domain-containing protein [bacterium]